MTETEKRVTLKINDTQHRFVGKMSKPYSVTQEELLGLMIDIFMANPTALIPHIERLSKRKAAEKQKDQEMKKKAANLVDALSPELQSRLLSGNIDPEQLEKLLR